jgi:hypothetical protein
MAGYTLIRSKRKSIAIHITKDAAVEVRAPLKASSADIDRFVASKQDWIGKHLAARKQCVQNKAAFTLNYGDSIPMQGKEYPIKEKAGNRAGFDGECFYILPGLSPEEIKHAVIQVYRMIAKNLLTNKVTRYAKLVGVTPIAVKINGAKTRWGSCSGKNSINFSWRLFMASDDSIDYVVVHELAHIKEHNHSDRFWAVVESVLPDYRERKAKLKELQKRLASEDWD